MIEIAKPGDNLGGIARLWAFPYKDVSTSEGVLQILSDQMAYAIYASPESINFSEKQNLKNLGPCFQVELSCILPKDDPAIEQSLNDMAFQKWVVVYLDNNENYKLVGSEVYPLRIKVELDSGTEISDLNHHQITFYADQPYRSKHTSNPFF